MEKEKAIENLVLPPIRTQKAYMVIVETFINLIAEGKMEYGHRLYNEAELMKLLDVSRSTLREALRVMEFLGIVSVSPRKGIRINTPSQTDGYPPLIYMLMFQKIESVELFEVRRALQVEMAGGAAERRSEENLARLRSICEDMAKARDADYTEFAKYDYDFHLQIAHCSENRLGLKLMQTLGIMLEAQLRTGVQNFPVEQRRIIIDFHNGIMEAIANQNVEEAKQIMNTHLEKPYRTIKNSSATFSLSRGTYGQL